MRNGPGRYVAWPRVLKLSGRPIGAGFTAQWGAANSDGRYPMAKAKTERDKRAAAALRCEKKFLRFFPRGFRDETYVAWERDYKWQAHRRWQESLGRDDFRRLIRAGRHAEVAAHAVRIESRTNLLFSFEKMALRDAVRSRAGAKRFAEGLFDLLHGGASEPRRFERWVEAVEGLPRRQTRVR